MSSKREPKKELLANLLELVEACPAEQCNPVDCPLYELRKMTPPERLDWLRSLPEPDQRFLASYHYICLATKLRGAAEAASRCT